MVERCGKLKWLATHNMVLDSVNFCEEPNMDDKRYIKLLVSQVTSANFS